MYISCQNHEEQTNALVHAIFSRARARAREPIRSDDDTNLNNIAFGIETSVGPPGK